MEKATWKFKDELIQYKWELWIYIVEVYDPINDRKECWIMDQNKVIAKEPVGNTAFARLWEEVEKKYQELKAQYEDQRNEELIDEELMRRAEERWEEYEPEYWTDYEPYLDAEE